ncbi:MAG: hypothetical protein M1828_007216 [Chrysothrix sp. TS-e1954]|nr:MAG: hypothetical protein M1828_007216 [Chrysothrix sp. TS-e1954]
MSYPQPIPLDLDTLNSLLLIARSASWIHIRPAFNADDTGDEDPSSQALYRQAPKSLFLCYEYPGLSSELDDLLEEDDLAKAAEKSTPAPQISAADSSAERRTPFAHRFVGNMMIARIVRATYQSGVSMHTRHDYLSPWGDNNPITLPNLRVRDVVLAAALTTGSAFMPHLVLVPHAVSLVMEIPGKILAEQIIDEATSILPLINSTEPRIRTRVNGYDAKIKVKHALLGTKADIEFIGPRPTRERSSWNKGWFCPYLYASGRTPVIARDSDFEIAQLVGPGLPGDPEIAPTLLKHLQELEVPCHSLCSTLYTIPSTCPRIAVFFIAITSPRQGLWSQARRPNKAVLRFHLSSSVPTLVLPVKEHTPICAWSSWTVRQILYGLDGYDYTGHRKEMLRYLELLIDERFLWDELKPENRWQRSLEQGLEKIIQALVDKRQFLNTSELDKLFTLQRAGIVMFRF